MENFSSIKEYSKKYSVHSTENQRIIGELVRREVNSCVTSLIDWVLSKEHEVSDPFYTWDEVSNYYSYPELSDSHGNYFEGGDEDDKEEKIKAVEAEIEAIEASIEAIEEQIEDAEEIGINNHDLELLKDELEELETEKGQLEDFLSELEYLETEPAEILEWWDVSGWFAGKLEAYGECILSNGIWGRQTSGQAILLDYVVCKIAFDMGILEGQANQW